MIRLDDETLMAYADGALDEVTRQEVEHLLESNPDARRMVDMFRQTASLSREAFDAPMQSQPPKALVNLILSEPSARGGEGPRSDAASPAQATVIAFDPAKRRASPVATVLRSRYALALAASVALMFGVGTGYLMFRGASVPPSTAVIALGPVASGSAMARVLETIPTGTTVGRTLMVATFRDRNDRVCREVEQLGSNAQPEMAGVACRQPNGGWIVEGAARVASAVAPPGTISVPSGTAEKDALASLLTMLGAKTVMTPAEEKALLSRGWK